MFDRQEILRLVAEQHGIIVSGDDPILSVLAVSDVIYAQQSKNMAELIESITMSNSKKISIQLAALQSRSTEAIETMQLQNQRALTRVFSDSLTEWDKKNSDYLSSLAAKINEFKKIRNISVITLFCMIFLVGFLAITVRTKGL